MSEELLLKDHEEETVPSTIHRNASWGAIIAIVVILLMIVVGAFYAWGERLAQQRAARAIQTQQSNHS